MLFRARILQISLSSLLLVGCGPSGSDGAIVTSVDMLLSNGSLRFSGHDCTPIVLDGHSITSRPSYELWATYSISEHGEFHEKLYIQPEGAPDDFEVTTDNGEVAMEWTFTPSSFGDEDFQIDEIETHHGHRIWVSHWGAQAECENADHPEAYEYPVP